VFQGGTLFTAVFGTLLFCHLHYTFIDDEISGLFRHGSPAVHADFGVVVVKENVRQL
jgi:hypothetical protein